MSLSGVPRTMSSGAPNPSPRSRKSSIAARTRFCSTCATHPDVQFLRTKYQAQRWGKGEPKPLFGAYVFAQGANANSDHVRLIA